MRRLTTTTVTKNIEVTEKIINNCPEKIANLDDSQFMDFPSLEALLNSNDIDVDDCCPSANPKPNKTQQ